MTEKRFVDIEIGADIGQIRLYTTDEDYETYDGDDILNLINYLQSRINDYNVALKTLQDLTERKLNENEWLKKKLSEQGTQLDFLKDENIHMREFLNENKQLKKENDKIKSLLFKKIEQLNNDYERSARAGMPTGAIIGELDSFEELCEKMGWIE